MGNEIPAPPAKAKRRFSRVKLILVVLAVVAAGLLAIGILDSVQAGNPYGAFRRTCLAKPGNSVVTLGETQHNVAMGGPETEYRMGCRQPNGEIISTINTNSR
jgi:hypothetical protein